MKKLYKSRDNVKIDGVCAGIADYLAVDVTLVRLLTAVGILVSGGVGIVAYVVCACIMPRESKDKPEVFTDDRSN